MNSKLAKLVGNLERKFQGRIVTARSNGKGVFLVDGSLDNTVQLGRPVFRPLLHDLVDKRYAVIFHSDQVSGRVVRVRAKTPDLYLDPKNLATNKDDYVSPLTLARIIELVNHYPIVISS